MDALCSSSCAALEGNRWSGWSRHGGRATPGQVFWSSLYRNPAVSMPILIRLIEAFKIVDLPNVLTRGRHGHRVDELRLSF